MAKKQLGAPSSAPNDTPSRGDITKANVGLGNVTNVGIIKLGLNDAVPGGTPAGTIILRGPIV